MTAAVDILVPEPALPTVRMVLGTLPSTTLHTHLRPHAKPDLVITSLDLPNVTFRDLVLALAGKGIPVVVLMADEMGPRRAGLEGLARLAHHARREPYIAPTHDAVRRVVLARRSRAEKELIASASVEDGKLVVWSCEPRRFEVPIAEVPVLARMPQDAVTKFVVSDSGSRIRWSDADVDINLDTIREYADPEVRREHEARSRREAALYAKAIRRFREERGLKQFDIQGLTERQVRRLEKGDAVPQIETLRRLAAAHGMEIDSYLHELAKRTRRSARRTSGRKSGRQAHSG